MEKQRLGHGDEAEAAAAGGSTRNTELKDAVVPAAGPKEDEDEDEERPSESEAKSVDVDDLLDPERNLNPDKVRTKEAIMDTSLVASTKDLDKHSLSKDAEKEMEKDNEAFLLGK
ncbi:hypothetical protein H4217_009315 [Coemansia sp. RSA 1939]|nr:hypothetical protein H4217_009315 [Coemansia sp. RSA 1939]